ncbi:MAG: gluconokinase [Mobilicoccus sp.]|nr:gluconokinase [Mobilicoccus sp.]
MTAHHLVVMGVSASGKTTVAEKIRDRTGWIFAEADDFHPRSNIEKMERGVPLTDEDRQPWLEALAAWIEGREKGGVSSIVTCSALKKDYRDILRGASDNVVFIHLHGDERTLTDRIEGRSGHFMPASLLESQLDTLEELDEDENGYVFNIELSPDEIAEEALRRVLRV